MINFEMIKITVMMAVGSAALRYGQMWKLHNHLEDGQTG